MNNCKTCLLKHAEVGDDLTAELAVELSAAKAEIGRLQAENAILNVVLSHVENEIKRLRAIIQFVRDKCVCRDAGGQETYAYLWKHDFDEFEKRAAEAMGGDDAQ